MRLDHLHGRARRGRPWAKPIREYVEGSPYQSGQRVRVVSATDPNAYDVSGDIGVRGTVLYLEYECGSGQTYPTDPMIGVEIDGGKVEEFWSEEIEIELDARGDRSQA